MATMYANYAVEVQGTINLAAYEDVDAEFVECAADNDDKSTRDDDRSTRASSGGSDHASSSGSDDESNVKMKSVQGKRGGHVVKPKPSSGQKLRASAPEFHIDAYVQPAQPLPTLLSFPPGLEPPPGLGHLVSMLPPGLEHPSKVMVASAAAIVPYTRKEFRKTMTAIFKQLRQTRTAALNESVERVRVQNVPQNEQPALFSEMMTRAVEEMSGPGRRQCMAFVTGVAAGSPSAFAKEACLAGIKVFFQEIYEDLMDEVPKLQIRVEREFLPVLRTAFNAREINEVLPARLRVAP